MTLHCRTVGLALLVLLAGCGSKGNSPGPTLDGTWSFYYLSGDAPGKIVFEKGSFRQTFPDTDEIDGNYTYAGDRLTLNVTGVGGKKIALPTSAMVYSIRWEDGNNVGYLTPSHVGFSVAAIARNGATPKLTKPSIQAPATVPQAEEKPASGGGLMPQPTSKLPASNDSGSTINTAPPPSETDPRRSSTG